ncbi:MAG: TIM barrel protein, partial [Pseudomonadota bacterium]|nr:TIM barrel protein [Pseudomonadota bacterium]
VRIMLQSEADIPHAQRAADEAAERGITLAQQTHWGTLCETVEESLDVVRRMDRQNFGITFEPANLLACGNDCGPGALRRLAPISSISTSKTSASIPMGRIPSIAAMPAQPPSPT